MSRYVVCLFLMIRGREPNHFHLTIFKVVLKINHRFAASFLLHCETFASLFSCIVLNLELLAGADIFEGMDTGPILVDIMESTALERADGNWMIKFIFSCKKQLFSKSNLHTPNLFPLWGLEFRVWRLGSRDTGLGFRV